MYRLALNVAVLALITSLTRSDAARLFLSARGRMGHPTFEAVACRPPPWYRGFAREAPFVCAEFWGGRTYRNTGRLSLSRQANVWDVTSAIGEFRYCNVSPSRCNLARATIRSTMRFHIRPRPAERRRANLSIRPAQSFFPEFDYSRRKFTPSDPGASAGFRPHLKQGVIFAE